MDQGIPHSVFLGRAVPPGAPSWLTEDRDKVRAVLGDRAIRCSGCGTYPDESMTDDGRVKMDRPWSAETVRCVVCEEAETVRSKVPSEHKGVSVRLVRLPIEVRA